MHRLRTAPVLIAVILGLGAAGFASTVASTGSVRPTAAAPRSKRPTSLAVRAVAAVQHSAWGFTRIFPKTPGTTTDCAFRTPIHATCRTAVDLGLAGPAVVTFTETWQHSRFHAWRFDVGGEFHGPRATLVGQRGHRPPQGDGFLGFTAPANAQVSTIHPANGWFAGTHTGARVVCIRGAKSVEGTVPRPGKRHGWSSDWSGTAASLVLIRHASGSLVIGCR